MVNLTDMVVLITGAARGIGAATVQYCLEAGATVLANCRSEEGYQQLTTQIEAPLQKQLHLCLYDVCDADQVKDQFRQIQNCYGSLHGLVNNAGTMLERPIAMTKNADLEQQLAVNAVAAFQHLQLAGRLMTRQRQGSIVNLASVIGEKGSKGQVAYSMAKGSVSAMTRAAAQELAPLGIRVNAVAPGFIETDMTGHYSDEQRDRLLANIPLNRFGQPADVAQAIGFLLSQEASYITGQTLGVDGAMNIT